METAFAVWISGGWVMIPLLLLTVFIYATALHLLLQVHFHFLVRGRVHQRSAEELTAARDDNLRLARQLVCFETWSADVIRRHFEGVRNEYIAYIDRRIRFLGIVIAAGPLLGLLGTVTGMLSTFSGMLNVVGSRLENIVGGISEALITTQTGLIISIPAMAILSLIIQRRNTLVLAIARLERYNVRLALRSGCPIPRGRQLESLI